jgi:hypothetical protein
MLVICRVAGTLPTRKFPPENQGGPVENGHNIGVTAKNDASEKDIRKIRIHTISLTHLPYYPVVHQRPEKFQ